ncbi:heterogeneous nuclear ribonucleoprotein Q [Malania oleifera]|uniref:heterogeneous nuclear ribonucleoprotein Q n=1 Tax=Malania oleifera TaxID=397392 RepID=UPI0025AE4A7B|nr:heterogeneous nuclear ribonucleoprotein Q [Malania oleifera]XP_057979856.1 heterogeneous nuclear ribonucleoprotein Q [Malania oleifera]XP_057979857.1 heterogeneous nuclear ribonucleoprotein Q [Malania oleifera]XP_057979858.1 heterogeneous nuclear ribonucleoprotein Q [Malania oleifera]XP_057979859.1 heterogeneous nuclear ribonucleoprotein Q [Malania oleifera]XP_057979861.1 heterogeneous nuclear ribonucleoprotein Q [Malania oleifera]XP_057979862.1 heterogeneous nuclear ribonucleoprotein Q [M
MAEGTEIEERVDLDEDNYSEEIDDDVEEHIEDEGADRGDDENVEGVENSETWDAQKDQMLEANGDQIATEPVEDKAKPTTSNDEGDKDKHSHLLALPPHGSEIFIGGLPRDVREEDLRNLCEPLGEVHEIRLMKNRDTGESKGYAFIAFKSKDVAQKAIEELHNKEFKGKMIRCSLSETKHRLFIGNIPKSWTDDDFRKVIEEAGLGIDNIELIKDPQNPSRNRGFAFIEYYNNACADYSRQKMSSANFKLDGNTPTVSWADPKSTPDHAAAAQVKALYVKNIPENTTSEQLKELFQRHGEVTKVVLPPAKSGNKRDFGFIHYAERSSALKAIKDAEKYEMHGQVLEVTLAKPQTDKKFDGPALHGSGLHSSYLPHPGYGSLPVNPYGSLAAGYGVSTGFQQPVIYGRGPMPAGMQMVPMVLPDGRIGYVLQQPGGQMPPPRPRRNDRSNGLSVHQGRGGSGSDDGNRGRRYRPY